LDHPAKVNPAHAQRARGVNAHNLSRDSQAHQRVFGYCCKWVGVLKQPLPL
jgi:hypothetical protein